MVSFVSVDQQPSWLVNALEKNLYNDLSGYARFIPIIKSEKEASCVNRSSSCLIDIYREDNIDALMLGEVGESYIDYRVYDVRTGNLVETGSISVRSTTMLKLRMEAFSAFQAFLEKGGILEQRQYRIIDTEDTPVAQTSEQPVSTAYFSNEIFIGLVLFICFPYLLTFIGKPRKHTERKQIIRRYFYPYLLVCLLVLSYPIAKNYINFSQIINAVMPLTETYWWLITILGGCIWAYFLILIFQIVVPHLQGIERIKQNALFPVIKAFFVTFVIKLLFIGLLFTAYFYGIYTYSKDMGISNETIVIFVLPTAGLLICYWIGLLLDVFAMSLDVKLVDGHLDYNSLTHIKVKRYLIGYLKRNGVTLNKQLVDDVVFIPGKNKGVMSYAGGLTRPRIVIEKELIDLAIARDYVKKLVKPVYRYANAFSLQPNLNLEQKKKSLFSMSDSKRNTALERMSEFYSDNVNHRKASLEAKSRNAKGIIYPEFEPQDDLPSLMSDNFDDMQIVEALLLEDAQYNAPYDEDAEVDDSSLDDKDFLFGIILQKLGGLLRHEHVFTTFYFYFRYKVGAKKKSYNFVLSKYFSRIADTFVVLNFGLHHLIQHLYFQMTRNKGFITSRRLSHLILESQDKIFTEVNKMLDERKRKFFRTDECDRIVWLSMFCVHPMSERKSPRLRFYFKLLFSISVISVFGWIGYDAYQYNDRYISIIEQEKQAIREAIEKANDEGKEEEIKEESENNEQ
ncbi:MAG: hypothetical protein HWE27_11985 [Gammaproteobacteria bacterium]|nr:hypothetical protein [Gammaproteobacteria bacterium]